MFSRRATILLTILGGCAAPPPATHQPPASQPGDVPVVSIPLQDAAPAALEGRLVFHSDREGRHRLFTVDLPSRRVTRITEGRDHHDEEPAVSPDGARIAFVTTRFDYRTWDIAMMNMRTGAIERVSTDIAFERHPAWAPDGSSLFFSSERDGTQAVFRTALATRALTRVTPPPDRGLMPAMSPDGRRVAHVMGTREGLRVVVQDLASGERRALTAEGADSADPEWSPDGARLAYTRLRPGGSSSIEVLTLENGAIQSLAIEAFAGLRDPAWSPDGRWLAAAASASSGDRQNWDLVMFDTGPDAVAFRLTTGAANDRSPSWLPR